MNQMTSWKPPQDIEPQRLLVVAVTGHFFHDDYVRDVELPPAWGLQLECRFSSDLSLVDEADALWFHGPSIRALPRRRPGQKWIVMSMESDVNYPFMREKRAMELFDIHMTYRLDSDVPVLYPNWHHYGSFMEPPLPLDSKKPRSPLLYVASNPVAYRDDYIAQLMQHIDVDSPGRCLNNMHYPQLGSWTRDGFARVLDLIRQYRFYLAFENSRTTDYVTERVLQALVAGTVPVYCGAPNVSEFMPADNAIINAGDFTDARELADYLRFLAADDDAYRQHLAWKQDGYSEHFRRLVDVSSIDPLQRMFVKLAHGCAHGCRCGGRMR